MLLQRGTSPSRGMSQCNKLACIHAQVIQAFKYWDEWFHFTSFHPSKFGFELQILHILTHICPTKRGKSSFDLKPYSTLALVNGTAAYGGFCSK